MAQSPIAANIYQASDIRLHLAPQISLNLVATANDLTQRSNIRLRQILDLLVKPNSSLAQNLAAQSTSNAIDVRQANFHSFVSRQIYPCNTRHTYLRKI